MKISEPVHPTPPHAETGHRRERALPRALELVSRHALFWIVVVGATVRFATLGAQGFWLDEAITLRQIGLGLERPAFFDREQQQPSSLLPARQAVGGGVRRGRGRAALALRGAGDGDHTRRLRRRRRSLARAGRR